jgi:vitamin B12 transporter
MQSRDDARRLLLGFSLNQPLGSQIELKLDAFHSNNQIDINTATLSNSVTLQSIKNDERVTGGGAKILWRIPNNLLIAGIDYQHDRIVTNDALVQTDISNRHADRWGFYLNDTYTLGTVSLTSGLRYDLTDTSGDQFSPSLGLTWQLTDSTLIRGYTASGYSLPAMTLV